MLKTCCKHKILFCRLVVASYLSQNVEGTALNLRNTAIMPNIHGFHTLVSLIFCPEVDLKPVEDGSFIGSILCGLGYYEDLSLQSKNRNGVSVPISFMQNQVFQVYGSFKVHSKCKHLLCLLLQKFQFVTCLFSLYSWMSDLFMLNMIWL